MIDIKLVDVCGIQYGCPFDASLFSTSPSEGMPLIRIRDVKGGQTETYYSGEYSPEFIIRKGDYLIGMDGEFNIAPWQSEDALLNQRVCKIYTKSQDVVIRYVYRFLQKELKKIEDETPFVTVKHLSAKRLNQVYLPVPPIAEQEKIVAELDCLSGIIEKKKQQLKELDNLAQSIFYEMFGDPMENDKGWETKKVIDVVKLQRGYDLPIQHRQSDGGIPVWGSNGIVGWHNEAKVDYGVITGRSGTLGTVYSYDKPFFPLNTTLFSVDTHGNDIVYLKYLLNIFDLKRFGTGTGVPTLNRNVFHSEPIISVPLTLQQDFASKIEAIEKQKELIAQSIKETETLFNSRMDYYFN